MQNCALTDDEIKLILQKKDRKSGNTPLNRNELLITRTASVSKNEEEEKKEKNTNITQNKAVDNIYVLPNTLTRTSTLRKQGSLGEEFNKLFFKEKKIVIRQEKEFIIRANRIIQDPEYANVENKKSIEFCKKFGMLEELATFHEEIFLPQLSDSDDIATFTDVILSNENKLNLHLKDECLRSLEYKHNIDVDFNLDKISHDLFKTYLNMFETIKNEDNLSFNFTKAFALVKEINEQMLIIYHALKFIKNCNIKLEDFGKVLCEDVLKLKRMLQKDKDVRIFFTEKYIILTELEGSYYKQIESFLMDVVRIEFPNKKEMRITNFDKKSFLLYSTDDKIGKIKERLPYI